MVIYTIEAHRIRVAYVRERGVQRSSSRWTCTTTKSDHRESHL